MFRSIRLACAVLSSLALAAWLAPEVRAAKKSNGTANTSSTKKTTAKSKSTHSKKYETVIRDLREALAWLRQAQGIYNGHRVRAMHDIELAIHELHHSGTTTGKSAGKSSGKSAGKSAGKSTAKIGKGPAVVKLKDNNRLPVGWEVSNGHVEKGDQLVKSALGKLAKIGGDGHAVTASGYLQTAIVELNTGIAFMNSLTANAKKK